MTKLLPKELVHARELMAQAKFGEALKIIENLEKDESLSPEDQLSALLIKGKMQGPRKALQTFEVAYQMSQDLGLVYESIEALIGKAERTREGDIDLAFTYVKDAERRLNSLADDLSTGVLRRGLLFIKSYILFFKGNLKGAAELAQECLKLAKEEKFGNKLALARAYNLLGWITWKKGNHPKALEYAMKGLELHKELNYAAYIANDYSLIAFIYLAEGDYNQALQYCKQSSSIKETSIINKLNVLEVLSDIYRLKSKLNRALKYRQQAVALAEEFDLTNELILNLIALAYLYRMIGKNDLALENAERSLILSEKWGFNFFEAQTLYLLVVTYIEENSREKANRYFSRLSELYDQTKDKGEINISVWYLLSKAYMMKTSTRMRDRVEAQALYKKLIDRTSEDNLIFCLSNLCDLLLEELSMYNDPEILDEIIPLITKGLEMAETTNNYYFLAETKLLQAKLALIQMNIEEAKKLVVQAQRIADLHGLSLLASKISNEHDKLLEQVDVWDTVKKEEAPISERIKLASFDDVMDRLQGKSVIEPLKLEAEQPVLLILITEGNKIALSNPFTGAFTLNDALIVEFLSYFKTFSDQIFSDTFDRVKFGQYTILITTAEPFSICYMFQGQTYSARQKITHFTEAIKKNSMILNLLTNAVNLGRAIEVKEHPSLEELIIESFMSDPQQFRVPFKAYGGEEPFVFASYAHRDKLEVYPIIDYLNKTGINIWYDEGIPFSENWKKSIAENIERCQEFLVFLTPHILESEYVQKEISFALKKKKPFNTVYLKETKLPTELEFEIADIQALHKYLMPDPEFSNKLQEVLYTKLHE